MKSRRALPILAIAAALAWGAAGWAPSSPQPTAEQPAPVSAQSPFPDRDQVSSMVGARATAYNSLGALAAASSTIAVGTVIDQPGPLAHYPLPSTISTVDITQTLKGTLAPGTQLALFDLGTVHTQMEETSGPARVGTTYLLFLGPLGNFGATNGTTVDASAIYVNLLPVARYADTGAGFTLDNSEVPDLLPRTVTVEDVQRTLDGQ